jgi:type II secretory pathway component PulC
MKTYNQLFWNLLIALFFVSLGWFGWQTWGLRGQVAELKAKPDITVGTDKRLQTTVDELENRLKERNVFVFESRSDPLELSRVVISKNIMMDDKNFLAALEKKPRLSCIISGDTPRAIIRLRNKNHVVSAGDRFEGFQVADVGKDQVRLNGNGQSLTLRVEAATKDLAKRLSQGNFDF